MLVKCRICGEKINKDTAYKITVNGTNFYYHSKEEYEAEEARKKKVKEDKDKVYNLICDMFGYEIQNTQFFAEWKLWNKLKPNDIIYRYLKENEAYLQGICNRCYDTEFQKIRYFSAVLKNSLHDYVPKVEAKQPIITSDMNQTMYEIHNVNNNRRKSLEEMEDLL